MQDNLNKALEAAGIAWWEMILNPGQPDHGEIRFADYKAQTLGFDPKDERFRHYEGFTELINPADYENTMQAMRDHMEGKKAVYECLYRIKTADGQEKQFYDRGRIVERDGQRIKVIGCVTDVGLLNDYSYRVIDSLAGSVSKKASV